MDVYDSDGVIVSTPTGSTGYNLSAGGPIVSPKTSLILVTPILSHSLISRSIVLSSEEEIVIEVGRVRKTQLEEAVATFDGQMGQELSPLDRVVIKKARETVRLIHFGNVSFYEIVKPYLLPSVIALLAIAIYMAIRYKKEGVVKMFLQPIIAVVLVEAVYFALKAILQMPIVICTGLY